MNLKDKVVVVTGASAGIGKETAFFLAREKAKVVLAARRKERVEEVQKEIQKAGGIALAIQADVSDESQAKNLIETAVDQYGRIDVLINNAGIGLYATIEETSAEQMERIWRTNFLGAFYCISKVLPVMRKQRSGHIITISSMVGKRATILGGAYSSTKFALSGFMESLRMELRKSGIQCTTVYPGPTESEFLRVIENPGNRNVKTLGSPMRAGEVAAAIIMVIKKPSAEVILQRFGRTLIILNAISPSLVDWIVVNVLKRKL